MCTPLTPLAFSARAGRHVPSAASRRLAFPLALEFTTMTYGHGDPNHKTRHLGRKDGGINKTNRKTTIHFPFA